MRPKTSAFLKEYFTLALPVTLGNLLTWGIPFTDHFMTASLGSDASTGIFLSNQVSLILGFLVTGLESGISIVGSQALGEGDRGGYLKTVSAVLYLTLALSLGFTAISFLFPNHVLRILSGSGAFTDAGASFLRIIAPSLPLQSMSRILIASARAEGAPSLSLISPLTALISNVLLNSLLIGGAFNLGAVGVGYSTLISRGIELSVSLIFTLRSRKMATHPRDMLITSVSAVRSLIKTLLPILAGQAVWAFSNFFSTAMMSRSGGISAHAFAVTASLMNLVYTAMNGASVAIGIMISRSVGKTAVRSLRETHGISPYEIAAVAERIFISIGIISFIIISALREPFIALYNLDRESAALARSLIPIMALTFIATAYSAPSLFGIIKSGGDVGFVTWVDLLSFLILTLPLTLILTSAGAAPESVYLALRLEHLIKCPIAYARIRQGRFTRRLTAAPE